RLLEKKSPSLNQRLAAIKEIAGLKIGLRVHIGPFIPYISSLAEILEIIPKEVSEVNIELYHNKMGNFAAMLDIVESNLGKDLKEKINAVYNCEKNYRNFSDVLSAQARTLCAAYRFKIFLIVPDFNKFYSPSMNYENALI
ncbi:MAG: hypothetical protein PHQ96_08050, partial [Candidatus Omnitrophica bacterium]|nr:hypothetical protein [Candidatus Omnitrophota bacterium]